MGVAPPQLNAFTASAVHQAGVVRMWVSDEQIVEMWCDYDDFGLLHQRVLSAAGG
jgi:hypothetical protein